MIKPDFNIKDDVVEIIIPSTVSSEYEKSQLIFKVTKIINKQVNIKNHGNR